MQLLDEVLHVQIEILLSIQFQHGFHARYIDPPGTGPARSSIKQSFLAFTLNRFRHRRMLRSVIPMIWAACSQLICPLIAPVIGHIPPDDSFRFAHSLGQFLWGRFETARFPIRVDADQSEQLEGAIGNQCQGQTEPSPRRKPTPWLF